MRLMKKGVKGMLRLWLLSILTLTLLAGCGTSGGWPEEDLIRDTHGELENIERLDLFVENVEQKKEDAVRIEHFTTEGDPIYETLRNSSGSILLEYDATEDAYGSGEKWERSCGSIEKKENQESTSYTLAGCSGHPPNTVIEIRK